MESEDTEAIKAYIAHINAANEQLMMAYYAAGKAQYDALQMGAMVAGHALMAAQRPAIEWLEADVDAHTLSPEDRPLWMR